MNSGVEQSQYYFEIAQLFNFEILIIKSVDFDFISSELYTILHLNNNDEESVFGNQITEFFTFFFKSLNLGKAH
jgi:hypothetical protein